MSSNAARLTALQGAQILFYPTAIGWHLQDAADVKRQQAEAWELIQRSHAVANGCYVCAANRVGVEGALQFWGGSFVAGPFGQLAAKASSENEELLRATVDLNELDMTRRHWPFLRDRRIDAYSHLTRRLID